MSPEIEFFKNVLCKPETALLIGALILLETLKTYLQVRIRMGGKSQARRAGRAAQSTRSWKTAEQFDESLDQLRMLEEEQTRQLSQMQDEQARMMMEEQIRQTQEEINRQMQQQAMDQAMADATGIGYGGNNCDPNLNLGTSFDNGFGGGFDSGFDSGFGGGCDSGFGGGFGGGDFGMW